MAYIMPRQARRMTVGNVALTFRSSGQSNEGESDNWTKVVRRMAGNSTRAEPDLIESWGIPKSTTK
jgi:hypothetical protein